MQTTTTKQTEGFKSFLSLPFLEIEETVEQMDKARRRAEREGRPDPSGQIYNELVERLAKQMDKSIDDVEDMIYLAVGNLGFYKDRTTKAILQRLSSQ